MRCFRGSVLVVAALLIVSCVRNPVTGRLQFSLLSHDREVQMGQEGAKEVEHSMGLYEHAQLSQRVRSLGERLAVHSPRRDVRYRFHVVDMAVPNAFALPGGHIYVSRGLLALLGDESELAGVLGHEIGHVAALHAVERFSRSAPVGAVTGLAAGVTGIVAPRMGAGIARAGGQLNAALMAPHGRDQEREADAVGQKISLEAGFDPAGLTRALAAIGRFEELSEGHREASFLDSHPSTEERVDKTRKRAAKLAPGMPAPDEAAREGFVRSLDGLLIGPNPAHGILKESLYLRPQYDVALQFAEGWEVQYDRQAVVALAPSEDALIALAQQGEGSDPLQAAADFQQRSGARFQAPIEALRVHDLPCARALLVDAELVAELTWVAHDGRILIVMAATGLAAAEQRLAAMRPQVDSLHALGEAERPHLEATRLRVHRPLAGEDLEALRERLGARAPAHLLRVLNGLKDAGPLNAALSIKVPLKEPL